MGSHRICIVCGNSLDGYLPHTNTCGSTCRNEKKRVRRRGLRLPYEYVDVPPQPPASLSVCDNPQCQREFVPTSALQKFCCPRCQKQYNNALRYVECRMLPPAKRGNWNLDNDPFEGGKITMYGAYNAPAPYLPSMGMGVCLPVCG